MLRRIVERSRAVIVHNPARREMVRRACAAAQRSIEIPHLFAPPPLPPLAEALRYAQRLGDPGLRISVRRIRIPAGIEAGDADSARLRRSAARIAANVLPAGGGRFRQLRPGARGRAMAEHPGMRRLPYLPERDFWLAAAAIDACINCAIPPPAKPPELRSG